MEKMMRNGFVPFESERFLSTCNRQIDYNLAGSGAPALSIKELVKEPEFMEKMLSQAMSYTLTKGTLDLRELVADLYPGSTADNILITNGCSQANFTSFLTVLQPGDEVAIMLPNYMQIWGIAQNFGCPIHTFSLKEELGWGIDPDELNKAVTGQTRLIAVVNPNNPTGHIMAETEMDAVIAAADRVGAWILSDEVYAGAERVTEQTTPSFWGRYDRVLVTGSMAKAFTLPGLRVGWVVAPPDVTNRIWAWQDYVTMSTNTLGMMLASYALSPLVRPRLIQRTRDIIKQGYVHLETWLQGQGDLVSLVPPQAAAIAFLHYHRQINSTKLVTRLVEKSTLALPGDLFGMDHFLRVGFGLPAPILLEGLARVNQVLVESEQE
jgi:aspartate/methionine/tyrosine aminotransferase